VNEGCDLYREVTMNEAQLVKAIKTLVEKGDKARDKAEQFYVAAGQHLKTLKEQCSSAPAWEKLVKAKCGLGKSRAYELLQIGDGRTTVSKLRASTAKRVSNHRAASPLRNGENLPAVVEPEDEGDRDDFPREWDGTMRKCTPPPKPNSDMERVRRQGLLNRAAEAIHLARYDDLEGLAIDSEMRRAICEATDAWRKLENAVDVTGAKARSEVAAAIAADLAEQAENAIVVSPAAEPADVIEPDDCDGELV
jgi:hypothetical protein